jgi:hypothetical protein
VGEGGLCLGRWEAMPTLARVHCYGRNLSDAVVRLQPRAARPGGAPPAPPPRPHPHGGGLLRSLEAYALTEPRPATAGLPRGAEDGG